MCYDKSTSEIDTILEIAKHCRVKEGSEDCDTVIYTSLFGKDDIRANKKIQMCHTSIGEIQINPKPRKNIDLYVTVSEEAKKQLDEHFNVNSLVIENELNPDIEELSNEKIDLQRSDLNLVTVSRISQEKGFESMLELAEYLKQNNINFIWYVVGGAKDKNYEKKIKEKFNHLKEVIFVGKKMNPFPYIKWADKLVQLSVRESDCLSVREALALKTPVIVSNWRGVDKNVNSKNGYILEKDMSNLDINKILKKQHIDKTIKEEYHKWLKVI